MWDTSCISVSAYIASHLVDFSFVNLYLVDRMRTAATLYTRVEASFKPKNATEFD